VARSEPGPPEPLHIETRCRSIDELVAAFATFVDARSIVVLTDQRRAVGARVRFAIALADGTIAMRGEAHVVEATPPPRGRLRLRFSALDPSGRIAHQRMLDRKQGAPSTPMPAADSAAVRALVRVPELASAPSPPPSPSSPPPGPTRAVFPVPAIAQTPAGAATGPPAPRRRTIARPDGPEPAFGIDRAIALARRLPDRELDLVVTVMKAALESAGVELPPVIVDSIRRLADLEDRLIELEAEIAEYAAEIGDRLAEVARLEADYRETSTVRERLELAERRR
jgi:hypothetical protein